jgi:hypothetical protein
VTDVTSRIQQAAYIHLWLRITSGRRVVREIWLAYAPPVLPLQLRW